MKSSKIKYIFLALCALFVIIAIIKFGAQIPQNDSQLKTGTLLGTRFKASQPKGYVEILAPNGDILNLKVNKNDEVKFEKLLDKNISFTAKNGELIAINTKNNSYLYEIIGFFAALCAFFLTRKL